MLFDFLDAPPHEERVIATHEGEGLFIDTCSVSDSDQPYETAIAHPHYNDGELIVVELYDTKEEAQKGHDKWVGVMTADKLPLHLEDVSSSEVQKFGEAFGVDFAPIKEKGER